MSLWLECLPNGPEDRGSIPGRVIPKTQKMVLDAFLNTQFIRDGSRVKWSNLGKGVAPFSTPQGSSYWKGSLQVTLDYGRQIFLLIVIDMRPKKREWRKRTKKKKKTLSGYQMAESSSNLQQFQRHLKYIFKKKFLRYLKSVTDWKDKQYFEIF